MKKVFQMTTIVACLLTISQLAAATADQLVRQADALWPRRHVPAITKKHLALLNRALAASPNHYGANWRWTWSALYRVRNFIAGKQNKLAVLKQAIAAGTRAITANPNGVEGHFWLGVSYGESARLKGGLGALGDVGKFKKQVETALRLNPNYNYGSPVLTLARMYYMAPGWPVSFGDNKKSLAYIERALKTAPKTKLLYYFSAETLWRVGQKNRAKDMVNKGLAIKPRSAFHAEDGRTHARLEKLQKKYSR